MKLYLLLPYNFQATGSIAYKLSIDCDVPLFSSPIEVAQSAYAGAYQDHYLAEYQKMKDTWNKNRPPDMHCRNTLEESINSAFIIMINVENSDIISSEMGHFNLKNKSTCLGTPGFPQVNQLSIDSQQNKNSWNEEVGPNLSAYGNYPLKELGGHNILQPATQQRPSLSFR